MEISANGIARTVRVSAAGRRFFGVSLDDFEAVLYAGAKAQGWSLALRSPRRLSWAILGARSVVLAGF
jgi:hypothetical protein